MQRSLAPSIEKDLPRKIVLISGPRQAGKTTLSKALSANFEYLNYDNDEDRNFLEKKEWDRSRELLIFDELHKMKKWKSWLKGIYDKEGNKPAIVVTGSAKLDTYKKVGDSLAGRFFSYRLYPFDIKELKKNEKNFDSKNAFSRLLQVGGFPEPYLETDSNFYKRWRKSHVDIIIKQDLITLENVTNITGIENLIRLMRTRVGSTISHRNLAQDLDVDPKTVKHWLGILENLYVLFKVPPYSRKLRNSILKAPKYYFYDNGQVDGDEGAKLENLTACALLKELHFLEDVHGREGSLHFLRTKKGQEIDFLVCLDGKPVLMLEVKWASEEVSKHFAYFTEFFPKIRKVQLLGELKKERSTPAQVELALASNWLSDFEL